jgi:hypothetical protein
MIAALVNGKLARADYGLPAACPECHGEVYARLPAHAIRHWAHKPLPDGQVRDCTRDAGEMSEWHRAWQAERTDLACIEVQGEGFRADVVNAAGFIIEFQRSRITEDEVRRREQYWRKGVWVADGHPDEEDRPHIELNRLPGENIVDDYWRFTWRPMPGLVSVARWPVWVDVGDRGMLQVAFVERGRGRGWLVPRQWFIDEVINGTKLTIRSHVAKSQSDRNQERKASRARPERDEDLSQIPVYCYRPTVRVCSIPDCHSQQARPYMVGPRCAEHTPARLAGRLEPA